MKIATLDAPLSRDDWQPVHRRPQADLIADAVVLRGDRRADIEPLRLKPMGPGDILVDTRWSGISTGTERMFWSGDMPPFPGFSYPLVPGYESVGRVISAPHRPDLEGRYVFVPGATCFEDAAGLFGATASRLVVPADRVTDLGTHATPEMALLALAATAHHAIVRGGLPDLIIGHGVLGRLAARITRALDRPAPTVWEIDAARRGAEPYPVINPETDERRNYTRIMDLSGDAAIIDKALGHCARGAAITLAGFYKDRPSFAFPMAFMKEVSLHVAAEWTSEDMDAVLSLVRQGRLALSGLITHSAAPSEAEAAYATAFGNARCLKLIIDWADQA
ncbi:MAG: chlorophyll synthesis pathway protein BchC [Pseudomonadota bacterium]